jgi:hypothetical protein
MLTGYLCSTRMLVINPPDILPVGLLSRQPNEGGYVGHAWLGYEMPTQQEVQISNLAVVSRRQKVYQLIKQDGAFPDPKEEDDILVQNGPVPGMWSQQTIKNIDVEQERWVFKVHAVFSKSITPLTVTPTTLPNGIVGVPYNQALLATGGYHAPPYGFVLSSGTLPSGLSLNSGVISGTPTIYGQQSTFTVTVSDTGGQSIKQTYTMFTGINILPASLPNGKSGTLYVQQLTAVGATGAVAWSVSSGSLPPGIMLNPSSGLLMGTP